MKKEDKKYDVYFSEVPKKMSFVIDEVFFCDCSCKEDFSSPLFDIDLDIRKENEDFIINFDLKGKISLKCDLSFKNFIYPMHERWTLIVKFQSKLEEEDFEDLIFLPFYLKKINIAKYIYEKILLSLPIKRLHPKLKDKDFHSEELDLLAKYIEIK